MEFEVVCLHKYRELVDQSVELLNREWPRSKTARLRSFEQNTSHGLPTSLVLIDKQYGSGKEKVVAHSKISPVPCSNDMCYVESVVVAPELRGKGLGRLIMKETEAFVLALGITTVYLTTHDQQPFYEKLGYAMSEPVIVYGGRCQALNKIVAMNMKDLNIRETVIDQKNVVNKTLPSKSNGMLLDSTDTRKKTIDDRKIGNPSFVPPPPPPPLVRPSSTNIAPLNKNDILRASSETKVTMKKCLLHKNN